MNFPNPFPSINDPGAAPRLPFVHRYFPKGGYQVGEFFVCQHGSNPRNLFVFEVQAIDTGGRATKTRLISSPQRETAFPVQTAPPANVPMPNVVVSGDGQWGVRSIEWALQQARDFPGTIGGAFVDEVALREYKVPGDELIRHHEVESQHFLLFTNGSSVFIFPNESLAIEGHVFNFVTAYDVTDADWAKIRGRQHGQTPTNDFRLIKGAEVYKAKP